MGAVTKVYLITGFLGSGKTTFLNRVIRSFPRDRKLMILMNEFGEVGVDGTLVEGEDLDILEISKGSIFCVCVKTDFIKGLHQIAQTIRPDVLLMESTGVANPTDLRRDLQLPFFQGRFELAEQFCLIDAVHFQEEYEIFSSVEKQIASSTVFLLNKVDLATPEQLEATKALVARHHPDPRFFVTTYADAPVDRLFFQGEAAAAGGEADEDREPLLSADELEAAIDRLLEDPNREVTPPDRLLSTVYRWGGEGREAFEALARRLPKEVVRAKGFVVFGGETLLFSKVLGRWTLEPAALRRGRVDLVNRLVFIGPPEAMPALAELAREFSGMSLEAVTDPMAAQGYECE